MTDTADLEALRAQLARAELCLLELLSLSDPGREWPDMGEAAAIIERAVEYFQAQGAH